MELHEPGLHVQDHRLRPRHLLRGEGGQGRQDVGAHRRPGRRRLRRTGQRPHGGAEGGHSQAGQDEQPSLRENATVS